MPAQEKQRPPDAIVDAAFEAIMTPTLKRLLDSKVAVALVIIVPTPAWVVPLHAYWKRRLGDRWHIFARAGSVRLEHRSSIGNSAVSGSLADGRPVVGIAASPEAALPLARQLPSTPGLGGHLAFTSTHDGALKAVARDKDLLRRVERHLAELDAKATRLVARHRRAILDVADALAEARYLSGDAIQQIFDDAKRPRRPKPGSKHGGRDD